MRFSNQRLAQLFDLLKNETLPQDELARRLAVSTRTVRNDIIDLNQRVADHGACFVLVRGSGYQLRITDKERYGQLLQQAPSSLRAPRTASERLHWLLIRFLTSGFSLKLDELADECFVSRNTLQSDMVGVRAWLSRYALTLETRPRYGMKLFGSEMAMRSCLTDLLYQIARQDDGSPLLHMALFNSDILSSLQPLLLHGLSRFNIRLADDGESYLRLYCAVAVRRMREGYPLSDFSAGDMDDDVCNAARHIIHLLCPLVGKDISPGEEAWLRVNIVARRVEQLTPSGISPDDGEALADYLLSYINSHYNYDLQQDLQLRADLLTHIKTMVVRLRYQIAIANPLLENIKQHYPLAYDVTLAAVASWGKYTPYVISENEVGFLVLHIGVGLERYYNVGYQRFPQVLLVCDSGNSTVRMIQTTLQRYYPQLVIKRSVSLREYTQKTGIEEDFVISTVRLSDKDKPVVVISVFPTDYQLEQIGKQVLMDRTRPYILDNFFDSSHFCIVDQPLDRSTLFRQLCARLEREGVVDESFYPSVEEREAIVSTLLGEGIALPHSLGLMARKTCVYTVLAPAGIAWGDETAYVIFLLAISKAEYEKAMAIYDVFVTFLRARAMTRLRDSKDFASFKRVAMDCLVRV